MKRLPLLITIAAISFNSFAQEQKAVSLHLSTQKGTLLGGSNLSLIFNTDFIEEPNPSHDHYYVGLHQHLGYFIIDNLALGMYLAADIEQYKRPQSQTVNTEIGVFTRYYTGKAAHKNGNINKLRFFIEAGAGYGHTFDRYVDISTETLIYPEYNMLNLHLMPGLNYFVNRTIALELGLNYTYHRLGTDRYYSKNSNTVSLNAGLQFFIGKR